MLAEILPATGNNVRVFASPSLLTQIVPVSLYVAIKCPEVSQGFSKIFEVRCQQVNYAS
jgi:hypothetical protein